MARTVEMIGHKYGKITVTGIDHSVREKNQTIVFIRCACDCGKTFIARSNNLKSGATKSCGCANFRSRKHGESQTRLYGIWYTMRYRCNSSLAGDYRYYGGRGIKVCDGWSDFMTFKQWALSHGYSDDLTIDRINNDGNYEPSNCRWTTMKEQSRNKRPRGSNRNK